MTPRERAEQAILAHFGFSASPADWEKTEDGLPGLGAVIEQAIVEAVLEERSGCAEIADRLVTLAGVSSSVMAIVIREAIRARSQPAGLVDSGGGQEPAD